MSFSRPNALLVSALSLLAAASPVLANLHTAKFPATRLAQAKPGYHDDDDKTYASQSSVAAKTAFGTVPAADKSVAKALDAKALTAAKALVGKPGSFQGTVTKVYSPRTHSFVALDFAANYHEALTANIAPADYAKFPDLTQLEGKHVLVSGKFVAHGEATQLAVTLPGQIKIVP